MGKACTDLAGGLRGILLVRLELRAGQTLFLQQLIEFTHRPFSWVVLMRSIFNDDPAGASRCDMRRSDIIAGVRDKTLAPEV
jgi:hypothetical protein